MLKRIVNWLDRGRCECGRSFWWHVAWQDAYGDMNKRVCERCFDEHHERWREGQQRILDKVGAVLLGTTAGESCWLLQIRKDQLRPDALWVAELWEFAQGQKAGEA